MTPTDAAAEKEPMIRSNATKRGRINTRKGTLVAVVATACLLAAACSGGESAAPTTTTSTTPDPTTTIPQLAPESGATDEPPTSEWIVQVGGADDDTLDAVAARNDEVVATGATASDMDGAVAGGNDALVAVVGTDSEIRSVKQFGDTLDDAATGVGSGGDTTVGCGYTESNLGGPNAGVADAWCTSLGPDGSPARIVQQGGTEDDRLQSTAVSPEGDLGYAGGYTLGLFPGASDSSAGTLGGGDALMWQINPDGTPRWIRQFGTATTDSGQAVASTADGDGLLVGYTQGNMAGQSNGGTDGFIARFDREGLPRFVRQFGTSGADSPMGVAAGGEAARGTETFVTVGSTDGALAPALGGDVTDPTELPRADGGEPAPSNAGKTDAMVVAMDPGGESRWNAQIGSTGQDEAVGVGVDGSNVLVAGTTSGTLDTTGAPNAGGRDGFLAALDLQSGRLLWITQFGSTGDEDVTGLTITGDGLVVVSGRTTGALGDQPNAGGTDGFLIAYPLPVAGGSAASSL